MSTGGYELVAAVLAFSVVQSVFGVGLLVFGTPTLLLAGYSFEETLAYLLPCSMAISALQAWDGGARSSRYAATSCCSPRRRCFSGRSWCWWSWTTS